MIADSSPKDGSPSFSSLPDNQSPTPAPWPLADSSTPAAIGDGDNGTVERQQAAEPGISSWMFGPSSSSGKHGPWWKTRKAKVAFAAGALLLSAFVVLLTLGLLGYLRKVGPFASLMNTSILSQPPANPLSTIPLVADPFAIPPPTAAPTSTPTLNSLAGQVIPTNQPTLNAVRWRWRSPERLFGSWHLHLCLVVHLQGALFMIKFHWLWHIMSMPPK